MRIKTASAHQIQSFRERFESLVAEVRRNRLFELLQSLAGTVQFVHGLLVAPDAFLPDETGSSYGALRGIPVRFPNGERRVVYVPVHLPDQDALDLCPPGSSVHEPADGVDANDVAGDVSAVELESVSDS